MGDVKLIPVYYTGIVTGWGCTFCLHAVVGEGWYHKDFLNPLPGPKSRSAVCGYCCPWPFTLRIYSYVSGFPLPGFSGWEASWLYIGVCSCSLVGKSGW